MNSIHRLAASLLLICAGVHVLHAQTDSVRHTDSSHHVVTVAKLNAIEFYSRRAVEPFFSKWNSDTVKRLTIAHFGDSHIQPGVFTGEMRAYMQGEKGFGGTGIIFPYSAAKTYSAAQYKTVHYGQWTFAKGLEHNPKLPLGVSGMTIHTVDSAAGFTITFKQPLPPHYRKLRLYFKGGKSSYDLRLLAGTFETVVHASKMPEDVPYAEVMLTDSSSVLHVQMLKTGKMQTQFEFYGMMLESTTGQGLVYHSLGVGGSKYNSVLAEVLTDVQLPTLAPDLVILDFGTNDFLYSQKIPPELEREIIQTIEWVRQLVPGVTVMLTSTQDMYWHGANVEAAKEFSLMVRDIARKEGCAFYDWYRISGGQYAMEAWVQQRLGRADQIHLTAEGYALKGKLFSSAFERTLNAYFSEPGLDSLVLYDPKVKDTLVHVAHFISRVRHHVKEGESLSTIANKYGVAVADIKRANKLTSSTIVAGDYLTIEYDPSKPKTEGRIRRTPVSQDVIRYKVGKGDTLGGVAEKFSVSVKAIKKLNGLRSSKIVEGETLLIPKT